MAPRTQTRTTAAHRRPHGACASPGALHRQPTEDAAGGSSIFGATAVTAEPRTRPGAHLAGREECGPHGHRSLVRCSARCGLLRAGSRRWPTWSRVSKLPRPIPGAAAWHRLAVGLLDGQAVTSLCVVWILPLRRRSVKSRPTRSMSRWTLKMSPHGPDPGAMRARLGADTGPFTWLEAGHPAPLLFRQGCFIKSLDAVPHTSASRAADGTDSGIIGPVR